MNKQVIVAALSALIFTAPTVLVAAAQPAGADTLIVAQMAPAPGAAEVQGVVAYAHGVDLGLRAPGNIIHVRLHHGTVIHPTGLTLARGMLVDVHGYWKGGFFRASRIRLVH